MCTEMAARMRPCGAAPLPTRRPLSFSARAQVSHEANGARIVKSQTDRSSKVTYLTPVPGPPTQERGRPPAGHSNHHLSSDSQSFLKNPNLVPAIHLEDTQASSTGCVI